MNRLEVANPSERPWRFLLAAGLIVACGLAAYSNSFTDLFLGLDGKQSIRDNPHIRRIWPLSEALSMPLWPSPDDLDKVRTVAPQPGLSVWGALTDQSVWVASRPHHFMDDTPTIALRPTFSLSLALTNHFLGAEPWAHHAVNLAIHIAAALVLFGIVRRTLERQRVRALTVAQSTWWALAAALLWLVHPLQTESVTYIVQRAESLMGLLLFLSVYCAIRAVGARHRFWWQVAAVAACFLGVGSKQTAVFVPLLVLLHDYTFSQPKTKWSRPVFYLILAAPIWIFLLTHSGAMSVRFEPVRYLSYALAQPAVVLHYLRLTLWPDDLFLYVNTTLFHAQSVAGVVVPATILVMVFVATIYCIAQRHWLGFMGGWFFITLGPTSSFFDANDLIQEHRMYVPLAALAVLAVVGGEFAVRAVTPYLPARRRAAVEAALLTVVVLGLGIRTYVRNWDYHHEFAVIHPADLHGDYTILADHYLSKDGLIQAEASKARAMLSSPDRDTRDVSFAHFILGLAYERRSELQKAAEELEHVVALEPDFAYGHHWLGMVLQREGDLTGAMGHLESAIRIEPTFVYAYKELALVRKEQGDTAAASDLLHQALRVDPNFGEAYYELGTIAANRGDQKEAAGQFRRAIRSQPDFAPAHYELAMILDQWGDAAGSAAHLQQAVRSAPNMAAAQHKLARLLTEQGDLVGAAVHLRLALKAEPDRADAHHELGIILIEQENPEEAAEHFQRAISILDRTLRAHPRLASEHNELGMVLIRVGNVKRAQEHFAEAIRLRPDFAEAHNELGMVLRDRGDLEGAAAHFEEAVRLQPDFADAHNELAWVRLKQGELGAAAEHFRRALAINSSFAEAQEGLEHVQALAPDGNGAHPQDARPTEK